MSSQSESVAGMSGLEGRLLSIVSPAFNEAETIVEFHRAVRRAMRALHMRYEVVFVNDGSTDATLSLMKELRARHPNISIVDLSRNFGKEIAMTAGLDHARGDAVVVMDADLQHPPETIVKLVDLWLEGNDVVNAIRVRRRDENLVRRMAARAFYGLMNRIGTVPLPKDVGDFRLLSRKAVDAVVALREHHRFMKGVFAWVGFKTASTTFETAPRYAGSTKFNLWKLWNFSIEGITSHTLAPLKASTYLGLAVALFALFSAAFYVVKTVVFGDPVAGFPTVVTTMLFLGGVQLVVLGVIGEYLGRVYNEAKNRPLYFTAEVLRSEIQDDRQQSVETRVGLR